MGMPRASASRMSGDFWRYMLRSVMSRSASSGSRTTITGSCRSRMACSRRLRLTPYAEHVEALQGNRGRLPIGEADQRGLLVFIVLADPGPAPG